MKALISILCLTVVVCEEIIIQQIIVQRNDSLTIECSTNSSGRCMLMKNKDLEADTRGGKKFKFVHSAGCKFEAHDLQFTDNGDYLCHVNETMKANFSVLVTVKPNEPELWLSGERIENNTRKAITTRPDGSIEFMCSSFQGYPKSKFVWSVDNTETEGTDEHVDHVNSLINVYSTLTVNFDQMQYSSESFTRQLVREKVITCKVLNIAYGLNESRLLSGVFGRAYKTGYVTIKANPLDKTINPGEIKQIACEADGLPAANDFQIKRRNSKGDWELYDTKAVTNVTKAGVYMCLARNNENETYVESKTNFTFRDPFADVVSQTQSLTLAVILGIVFGSLLLIAILVGIGYFIFCRKASKGRRSSQKRDAANEQEIQRMNDKPAVEKSLQSEI